MGFFKTAFFGFSLGRAILEHFVPRVNSSIPKCGGEKNVTPLGKIILLVIYVLDTDYRLKEKKLGRTSAAYSSNRS